MDKYVIGNRIIHLPEGCEYVAACWNCDLQSKSVVADGIEYKAMVPTPKGKPYIDFVWIRGEEGDYWIDEDSPVRGGLNLEFALKIKQELEIACEYLKTVEKGNADA